jgi:hypothetical protein
MILTEALIQGSFQSNFDSIIEVLQAKLLEEINANGITANYSEISAAIKEQCVMKSMMNSDGAVVPVAQTAVHLIPPKPAAAKRKRPSQGTGKRKTGAQDPMTSTAVTVNPNFFDFNELYLGLVQLSIQTLFFYK